MTTRGIIIRLLLLLMSAQCDDILFAQINKKIDSLVFALKTVKEDTDKVNVLNHLSELYTRGRNLIEGKKYADTALSLAEKINYKKGTAVAFKNAGLNYVYQDNYPEAIKNLLISLKISQELGYAEGVVGAYGWMGIVRLNEGNYPEAMKCQLAALKLREQMRDTAGLIRSYNNIGIIYDEQHNYPEALKNYFQALKISKEMADREGIAYAYNNIGVVYWEEGRYSEALENEFASLKIAKEIGDKGAIAVAYMVIATVYTTEANYSEALANFSSCLKVGQEIGSKQEIAGSDIGIGKIYVQLKQNHEARQFLNDGLSIYKEISQKAGIRDSYEGITQLDSATGDWKGAYQNHKLYILYRDSLINEENTKKTVQFRMQYEFSKTEDSLKYEQSLSDAKLKQQQQAVLLKENELALSNKEKQLQHLAYLKSESDLGAEQVKEQEKEKQLTIVNQQTALESNQLKLEKTQLDLKENQLHSQRRQKLFFIGGFALMLMIFTLIFRNIKNRQRTNTAIAAERLRTEKADAAHKVAEVEMKALRAQMNPHFIFNSLNSIYNFIQVNNTEDASEYLVKFSKLMRLILENSRYNEVALEKELEALHLYMELESVRMDHKFAFEIVTGDLDLENTMIPPLILQPFVENAIWHGITNKKERGKITIRLTRENDMIICRVEDNGIGRERSRQFKPASWPDNHESLGMKLTNDRIDIINLTRKTKASMAIVDLCDEAKNPIGTRVEVKLPLELRV